MRNIKERLAGGLFCVALLVFLITAAILILSGNEYQKSIESYEQLEKYVDETGMEPSPEGELSEAQSPYLQIDFEGLKAVNPDVVAWIHIPALDISYPVAQGEDNTYYLSHLFSGEENKGGCIFMDYHNNNVFRDSNTIVYGHNMRDGSMFGTLDGYQDEALYQQYPYFYIYIPGHVLEYQVFSCYAARTGSIGYTYKFPKQEDFQNFLEQIQAYAGYDTGIRAAETDQVVTLSTCVNSNRDYRYLIHGKLTQKITGRN